MPTTPQMNRQIVAILRTSDLPQSLYAAARIEELEAEVARLREVLAPFAAVARGIPPDWPGHCRLKMRQRNDGSEYYGYHGVLEDYLGHLPRLDQWRQARLTRQKLAGEAAGGNNADTETN